jgi:MFS transporter, UMF1 family
VAGSALSGTSIEAVDDRRELFGWTMYDWANSTFPTTVLSCLLGPYLTLLAQDAVGDNGPVLRIGSLVLASAKSLYPLCVSLSVLIQVFFLPMVGAIADYSRMKKRLMTLFCYLGAGATCMLFVVTGRRYLLGGLLLVFANVVYGAANVLYNAFLPEIASETKRDQVSSRGYALGYLGGGILLALNLGLFALAPRWGIPTYLAFRISLLSAGVWWGGFALVTFARLRVRAPARPFGPDQSYLRVGWSELRATVAELRLLPDALRYLVSYLFYNDGIQTVTVMASVLLGQELFVARGLPVDNSFLLGLILMVQFVAFFGSLVFERLAALGTKNAVLLSLLGWSGAVVYAYAGVQTTRQAWVLAAVIAIVLGGSQALSRSLYASMIPRGREAAFFGIYEIADRGTSWIGPMLFGLVVATTNSYRSAMLSLIVLFVIGMVLLVLTDVERAVKDAGRSTVGEPIAARS